ncbi:hypothetical protein V5R04_15170 [Jonesiaceae bacterium BS-20]|uniref:Lipoprotein n=1 Tax=Jonesiaceae bacterium BS-20 TaxID=3120821 RepID=A0AAU7DWV0_9MICO
MTKLPRVAHGLLVAAVLMGSLASCSSELPAVGESLTIEQAETLAQARFRLAAQGPFTVEVSVGGQDDVNHLEAELTVDHQNLQAWGTVERGPQGLAITEQVVLTDQIYAVNVDGVWQTGELPTAALLVPFSMGADRPENAQILAQSDAQFLGSSKLDEQEVAVFRNVSESGQDSTTRLWVDEEGRLQRLDSGADETFSATVLDQSPTPKPEDLVAFIDSLGTPR